MVIESVALGGLLAAVFSVIGLLAAAQLRLEARMDARFEAVDRRFEAVDRRFDAVIVRLDRIETRLIAVESR